MTLIVSVRTAEGIVIAGDSISTITQSQQWLSDLSATCPHCHQEYTIPGVTIESPPLPSSTFPYTQKILPFLDKYGVGTYGYGQLDGKTIYFTLRELEATLRLEAASKKKNTVEGVARDIGKHAYSLLAKSIPTLDQDPDGSFYIGFQVVGYDEGEPKMITVEVGRSITPHSREDDWICWTGQPQVVEALYANYPGTAVMTRYFSLQDAIDYAQFLIRTTADFQRFSNQIPTVGGAIDVGLVTPFHGFKWIHQKPLSKILEDNHDTR